MDWVTRNQLELKRKTGVPVGTKRPWRELGLEKPGPKKGSHWSRDPEHRHAAPYTLKHVPLNQQIDEWPGPFVPRTDFPELYRTAYWINCAYCGVLFCRAVTWVKSRRTKTNREGGTQGTATFCSIACGKANTRAPQFRVCSYCAKTFRVWSENNHKRTCCEDCARSVMSEVHTRIKHMPLIAYAFEHGTIAEYRLLTCDSCGAEQRDQSHGKNHHWYVRISEINGKYVARCKGCYQKAYNLAREDEAHLTPAQKLRLYQAQQLIDETIEHA